MKRRVICILSSISLAFITSQVTAEVRRVPTDYSTIQSAVDASVAGDEIIVAPGTYTGAGNRDIDFMGKNIAIHGTDPNDPNIVEATVIDCQGTEADPHRGFILKRSEGPNAVLSGLTIMNGYLPGDMSGSSSDPNDTFGGAVYCTYTKPTITHCVFLNNRAVMGGGIGIYSDLGGGGPTITACRFHGNTAILGGGICALGPDAVIRNCLLSGNHADGYWWSVFGKLDGWGGGAIAIGGETSLSTLINCTIVNNSAGTFGGGVSCFGGWHSYIELTNCVLWSNAAFKGGAQLSLGSDGGAPAYGAITTVSYCDIQGGQAGVFKGFQVTLNWGTGNLDSDPLFRDPNGPDGDPNIPYDNDNHLTSDSPCTDTGDPNRTYTGQTDLDGKPRVMGLRVDMGADEYPKPPQYYTLELGIINGIQGSVAIDPNDPRLPPFVYPAGTPVTLTATPFEGKGFQYWRLYDPNYPDDVNHASEDANRTTVVLVDTDRRADVVWKCGSGTASPLMLVLAALGLLWAIRCRA